ncbi:FecR family protein [Hymenobacter roseosalivarius]|nr:FecR domain-containing protein [Hymenobacter roseosalivarius]
MNYAAYSTEDFLADESFQSFVIGHDATAGQFWRAWIVQNPARQPEFDEAVALLQLLATRQPQPLPEALKQEEAAKLRHAMHPPVAPRAQPVLRVGRHARRWASAVVAALALGFAGVRLWQHATPTAPTWTSYTTHTGEHREVTLPDGSRVTMNANSVLKLATTWQPGHVREVWLAGEAFFAVRHTAPAHLKAVATAPAGVKFVVHAGPLDVAVLGTQFNVLRRVGKTRVVLNTGQIQLRHRQAGRLDQVLLEPGELVEYNETAPQAALVKRMVRADFYSAWTSGQLQFDQTPVADIVALLKDSYGLDVALGNPALARQKLTGTVPNHDVDVLLNAVGKSLDVKVRRQGNRVWLE